MSASYFFSPQLIKIAAFDDWHLPPTFSAGRAYIGISNRFLVSDLMFVIDVTLKHSPITLTVQRKTEEDAKTVYQQVLDAVQSGNPVTLELTCEQMLGKKIAVLVSEVAAVQMAEKSSTATASGRPPGFFAIAE